MEESYPSIAAKIPSFRKRSVSWLEGKRKDDNAEGLWRIHDKLYDLINFVSRHPGGADWLELTQGTDVTELFESHHVTGKAEMLLPNFYVKDASEPRNYRITFCDDGFYKTLRRKVADQCIVLNKTPTATSNKIFDCLLVVTTVLVLATAVLNSLCLSVFTGISLNLLAIASHNYLHQRDNWRMYCFNLTGMNYREWRISHAISHHMYPNTIYDMETFTFEPLVRWLPKWKSKHQKLLSVVMLPLLWLVIIKLAILRRTLSYFTRGQVFRFDHLISFILPTSMFLVGERDSLVALKLWLCTLTVCSFLVGFIDSATGHHHPNVYHEGDELHPSVDFGLFQMNTTIDGIDIKANSFLNLTFFGHHTLHHLFPSLDHSMLPKLTELFIDTCQEFNIHVRESSWWLLFKCQFSQLCRTNFISLMQMRH